MRLGNRISDQSLSSSEAFRKLEDLYYGNISKWRKFVHSMQLRIAMRMSYVNPTEAQRIAQKAVEAGVIESNEDNAMLHVAENRSELLFNNWNDYRISADLVSIMKGYEDPRLDKMFVKGVQTVDQDGEKVDVYDYYGVRIGIFTQKKDDMINLYSKQVISSTDPYLWMNAAEVTFLRAEGALRGWDMGGSARDFYEQGVKLSFDQRKVSGADEYLANAVAVPEPFVDPVNPAKCNYTPKTKITIAWNEGASTEEKLERIITQKWIANFPLGFEGWADYRRTGYPEVFPSVSNLSNGVIDTNRQLRRLPFPLSEKQGNSANVSAAVSMLGGPDTGATDLWWAKKN